MFALNKVGLTSYLRLLAKMKITTHHLF